MTNGRRDGFDYENCSAGHADGDGSVRERQIVGGIQRCEAEHEIEIGCLGKEIEQSLRPDWKDLQ